LCRCEKAAFAKAANDVFEIIKVSDLTAAAAVDATRVLAAAEAEEHMRAKREKVARMRAELAAAEAELVGDM